MSYRKSQQFSQLSESQRNSFIVKSERIALKIFDSQTTSGYLYIRHLTVTNGGALAALLGTYRFLDFQLPLWACGMFALGLFFAIGMNGLDYLRLLRLGNNASVAEGHFMEDRITYDEYLESLSKATREERWLLIAEVIMGALAFVCFFAGLILAGRTLINPQP